VHDCATDWADRLGASDRVPSNWQSDIEARPHATILEAAGFEVLGRYEFQATHQRSLADIAGFLYSTSLLPRLVLGDHITEFEHDLATRLHQIEPSGTFHEVLSAEYDLARSP
jgi:hypothetical protein